MFITQAPTIYATPASMRTMLSIERQRDIAPTDIENAPLAGFHDLNIRVWNDKLSKLVMKFVCGHTDDDDVKQW